MNLRLKKLEMTRSSPTYDIMPKHQNKKANLASRFHRSRRNAAVAVYVFTALAHKQLNSSISVENLMTYG